MRVSASIIVLVLSQIQALHADDVEFGSNPSKFRSRSQAEQISQLAASLPVIDCRHIRMITYAPDGEIDTKIPAEQSCRELVQKHRDSASRFWRAASVSAPFEDYYAAVSEQASALCRDLFVENGRVIKSGEEITDGCLLNNGEEGSVSGLAQSYMMAGGRSSPLSFGSVCVDLPISHTNSTTSNELILSIVETLPEHADWQIARSALVQQGFSQPISSEKSLQWGPWYSANSSPLIIQPQWITAYLGAKQPKHRRNWPCSDDVSCTAGLEEYSRLKPEAGLCFGFSGWGP